MFLTLILAAALATNSSDRADESVLRTAAEVYALCELPHAPKTPFEVRGTVVYANIYGYAVIEDASGRAFFFNGKGDACHIGDDVVITGLAGVPNPHGHIPWMWNVSVSVVGQGKVPEPRDIRLADISPELPDLSTIRVEGEVLDVFPDEIDAMTEFLVLRDGGKSTLVSFSTPDTALRRSLERLTLARIRLTGTYFRHMSGNRLFFGPSITLSSTNDITMLAPAPADPFDAPPLNSIIRETPEEIAALERRSVVGTVIAVWRGNRVLVKTEEYDGASASGLVRLELTRDARLPQPGMFIRAVGRPATDHYRLNLVSARWQATPGTPIAETPPRATDVRQLLQDGNGRSVIQTQWHGRSVRIRGTVRRVSGADDANMITDSCLTDSDGGQDCQCEGCRKLRADYPGSDWYWKTLGEINAKIRARIPDLRNYTFAYGHGHDIPTDKSLVKYLDAIQYCPHGRCYVHPYSVKCPTNRADLDRCEAWQAADIPIGDFDYCYDVFQPSMNMPSWNITWDAVRYFKELNGEKGVPSIYMEAANHPKGCGGKSRASVYVVARAAWEGATTPAAEHLKDFVRCAYGDPAKEAFAAGSPEKLMLDWYEACAAAWGAQKTHLTATFNNPTGTAKTYFSEELEKSGAKAFAAAEQAIRARMASEGTPVAKMTRAQYLAWKQYETWAFEKRFAYDAWKELRDKAMSSSMTVNLELAGEDDAEFDRMPTLATRQTQWVTKGIPSNDVPRVTLKLYRTDKALRARFTVNAPAYRTLAPADCKEGGFAFGLDHVELFLQAPGMSDYYHLAARPDGTRYDALCKDSSFNSDKWRCTTRQREGFVEYDVTVAWDLFGAGYRPKPGDCIKFLAAVSAAVPLQKSGLSQVYSGFPREAAFHDLGVAADLLIDDNAGRRAGGK